MIRAEFVLERLSHACHNDFQTVVLAISRQAVATSCCPCCLSCSLRIVTYINKHI